MLILIQGDKILDMFCKLYTEKDSQEINNKSCLSLLLNWSLLLRIGCFVQMMETCHHKNSKKTKFQN